MEYEDASTDQASLERQLNKLCQEIVDGIKQTLRRDGLGSVLSQGSEVYRLLEGKVIASCERSNYVAYCEIQRSNLKMRLFDSNLEDLQRGNCKDRTIIMLDRNGNADIASQDPDGDGVPNRHDDFPQDASEYRDSDGDGIGDNADAFPHNPLASSDLDSDGVPDGVDSHPADPNQSIDTDGDGVADSRDTTPSRHQRQKNFLQ